MAIDYVGVPNGLFNQLGKIAKNYDLQLTAAQAIPAVLTEILDVFEAMTLGKPGLMVEGFATSVEAWKAEYTSRRSQLAALALTRLQDKETVLDQIAAVSTEAAEILEKLVTAMYRDAASIDASMSQFVGFSTGSTNQGNGRAFLHFILDGTTSPGAGAAGTYAAHPLYNGVRSELCVPTETFRITCTADSFFDGTDEGSEAFLWEGRYADVQHGYEAEGSGSIATITPIHSADNNQLQNPDFEDWTANVPDNWTIDLGVGGTTIIEETTAGKTYHGTKSLKFAGNGVLATFQVSQLFTSQQLKSQRMYVVAARVLADATIAAGTLTIEFEGTGYTPAPLTDEVQTVQISGTPAGGNYDLSTAAGNLLAIPYNTTSAGLQTLLRASLYPMAVVTTAAGAVPDITHRITFNGAVGDQTQIVATSHLTGGAPVITIATTTNGVNGEQIVLPPAALPTAWAHVRFFVSIPAVLPSDFKLVLKWTGTPTNAKSVWIDDLAVSPVTYGGGAGLIIVRGSTPFARGDYFTFDVQNNDAGIFQRFFRRVFGMQLPSNNAGAETIDDALAT